MFRHEEMLFPAPDININRNNMDKVFTVNFAGLYKIQYLKHENSY